MNQTEWIPKEDVLNNVLEVLQDSFVPDSEVQKDVQAKLTNLQNNTDLFNYFLLILEDYQRFDDKTRALAGLILKNNLTYMYETVPQYVVQAMKAKCLRLLTDHSKDVRSSVSTLINVIALKGGIENWPDVLPFLTNLLDNSTLEITDSAIKTLINICEDYLAQRFHISVNIEDSIKKLLVKFVELTGNANKTIRKHSFKILNDALQKFHTTIKHEFDSSVYLQKLINAASDPSDDIILLVCQGFVIYINNKDEAILPMITDVINYMMGKTTDANEEVALQACEFWFSISKLTTCKDILGRYLKDLVPILIKNMQYSEYELGVLKDHLGKDVDVQDRTEDVKPFAKTGDDDDDPEIGWTLRKCSAASLDSLSLQFQDDMVHVVMPLIMKNLASDDLLLKESGILALGAISDGCFNSLLKVLPELIPPLIQCMDNPHALIRSITCWTLSRYVRFVVYGPEDKFFYPVMLVLLQHSLDDNKRVQRAAISSFCFFQEEAKSKLVPHIDVISQIFLRGFEIYKLRSLYLLYDAIGVLALSVGSEFKSIFNVLMLPLLQKFNGIDDYNNAEEFVAICECLVAIVTAVDVEFVPYAEIIYLKCLAAVTDTVQLANQYDYEDYDKDLIAGALDLLVAMACNLKTYFSKFIINSNILNQLYYIIQDDSIHVRQPGLALLGEIVRLCYPYINNQIHVYIPPIIENLDKRFNGACNNAAWVVGKLCVAMEHEISPYAQQIIEHCLEILQTTDGIQTMYKTVSITLCTLGLVCPEEVSPSLKAMMRLVCSTIRNIADCEEKEFAFRGLCELVVRNPEVFATDFIFFCDAVASFNEINFELKEKIRGILVAFRQHVAYEPLKLMQSVILKVNEVCQRYLDNSMLCSLPSPGPPFNLVTCCSYKNTRKRMEDRHSIVHDLNGIFNDQEATPSSYYAIFDGHAGHDAAVYSAAHLHQFLAESKYFACNPEQALKDAFRKTDELFLQKCKVENLSSGTTAVCALLRPKEKTLYIAWVGDSQALLANQGRIQQCVNPHKPCRKDEKDRIEEQGGIVIYWGTWRVDGQLAVSRAIGDSEYKPYVIADPDVQEIQLSGTEDFLIIACDGLWDFLSEEDAAMLVYKMVYENPDDIESISQSLVQQSKEQGSTDNISVIVLFLREPSKIAAEAHWAARNVPTMEAGLDNANATNNPFTNSNGSEILGQKDPLLHYLRDDYTQNGSAGDEFFLNRSTNGKRPAESDVFDDDDLGPETDVDAVDDGLLSPTKVVEQSGNNNPFNTYHTSELEEKVAMEIDMNLQKHEADLMEGEKTPREETPTPPADEVHDGGLVDNVAESGDESEDEWNYYKGADKENVPPSQSDREVADIIGAETERNKAGAADGEGEESEDNSMSQLNPDAAEFVPISPTRVVESPICTALKGEPFLAQSPKRGPNTDIDINLPSPQDFEKEVKSRPSEIFSNGHENGHKSSSLELMENLLNGKNIDEIEFQPNSTPKKVLPSEEFHFGPNATPFSTPAKNLDQSEAFSTKANFGDESSASYMEEKGFENSFSDSVDFQPFKKEQDPMSMSFYQDKEDASETFDLNKVQLLPENVDDFIEKVEETFNETISELTADNAIPTITDLDKHDDLLGVCELPKSPQAVTPEPTLDENLCAKTPEPVIEAKETVDEELSKMGDVCKSPTLNFCGTMVPGSEEKPCPDMVELLEPDMVCAKSPSLLESEADQVCVKSPQMEQMQSPHLEQLHSEVDQLQSPELDEVKSSELEELEQAKSPELGEELEYAKSPVMEQAKSPEPEMCLKSPEPEACLKSPEPELIAQSPVPELDAKSPESVLDAKSPEPEFDAKSPEPELDVTSPEPELEEKVSSELESGEKLPESELEAKSPEPEVCLKSPEPDVCLKTPEPEVCMKSPEPEVCMKSPEPEVCLKSPEPEICLRSPEPDVCLKSPEPDVCLKSPEPAVNAISSPEPQVSETSEVCVASPEPEISEKSEICVESPEPDVCAKSPEPEVCAFNPETCTKSPEPEAEMCLKSPEPEISLKIPEPDLLAPSPEPELCPKSPELLAKSPEPEFLAKSPLLPEAKSPEPEISSIASPAPLPDVLAKSPEPTLEITSPEPAIKSPELEELKSPEPSMEFEKLSEVTSPEPEIKSPEPEDLKSPEPEISISHEDVASPEPTTEEICAKSPELPEITECNLPVSEQEEQAPLTCSLPLDACPAVKNVEPEHLGSSHEDVTSSVKDDEALSPVDVGAGVQLEEQKEAAIVEPVLTVSEVPDLPPQTQEVVDEVKVEPAMPEQEQPKPVEDVIQPVAVAAVAAAVAAVAVAAKPDDKKPALKSKTASTAATKKPISKSATSPSKTTAAAKPSAARTSMSKASTTAAKPAASKPSTAATTKTTASPKPISRPSAATAKPKVPAPTKTVAEKKPLLNGDASAEKKATTAARKSSVPSTMAKTQSTQRTVTKASPTKAAAGDKTAAAKTTTSKPSGTAAARTLTVSAPKPRPNTLATKTTTATKSITSTTANKTSTLSKTATSPKSTTTSALAAKPKPASAPAAPKPRVPLSSRPAAKAPDTEKQNKENVNKLTASRTSTTSKTTLGSVTNRTTTVRKVESKTASGLKSTMKTTSTTTKASVPKKPGDLAKNATKTATKTTTTVTKVSKPKENGIPNGVTTVTEITTVKVASNELDELLVKDQSPVVEENNLIIDNSQLPLTTVAD